jgi:DNA-binding LytR/AlgR family response regulator
MGPISAQSHLQANGLVFRGKVTATLYPAVMVMDILMRKMNGVTAAGRIKEGVPTLIRKTFKVAVQFEFNVRTTP